MYLMDYYTIPGSLAGLPSLSVPCAPAIPEDGTRPMPMGLQMTTPLFTERALLGYAHAYERATRHAEKRSPRTMEPESSMSFRAPSGNLA